MLEMYARCLEELKRSEEYVRTMLRLLAKFAVHTHSGLTAREKTLDASSIFTEQSPVSGYVEKLFEASGTLQKEVSAPFADFFADLEVKPIIIHYDDKDGFQMQLSLRFLLGKRIEIDSMKVRLVSAIGPHSNEHWIETATKAIIKSSPTKVLVDSTVSLFDPSNLLTLTELMEGYFARKVLCGPPGNASWQHPVHTSRRKASSPSCRL
jgi:hypothetical protein